MDHLRRQAVEVLQRARDAQRDPHALPPLERLRPRCKAADLRAASQAVVQRAACAELEDKAALRPIGAGSEGQQGGEG